MATEVISSNDFAHKVLEATEPVLVDFFATWCGPCKMLAPTIDEVRGEVAGKASVYKLDIDQSPDIAQAYGVMSVPTLIVFKNGQPVKQAVGIQPKQTLLSMLA
ncbi:thioredoxin [Adlercreutzia agrestimuris]|uniref:thioredoxin n=1 Tax=Adlercreutzia agrestimuris TaxID=2941324 RepID=UPI002041A0C1|nr:thioredoxin [Adlercreutzia agrestimuris]